MSDSQTLFLRPPVWAMLLAVVIGGCFYVAGKHLETKNMRNVEASITVTGEGTVFAAPDIAELSFGVATGRQVSAKEAIRILRERMIAIQAGVEKAGVEEKDIRTEQFWLNPSYEWSTRGVQTLRGYEANQSLRVKVRDLDKVSAVLEAATANGANQAGNVEFTLDDPEAKRAEARAEAIDQAKRKAQGIADDLSVRLGDVRGFSEGGSSWPGPIMMRSESVMGMGGEMDAANPVPPQVPLPAGEQEIRVDVTITYELE